MVPSLDQAVEGIWKCSEAPRGKNAESDIRHAPFAHEIEAEEFGWNVVAKGG